MDTIILISGIFTLLAFVLLSYKKKLLTNPATILSFFLGLILLITGGWRALIGIYLFFVIANIATKIKKEYKKQQFDHIHEKNRTRDSIQVLANGLIASILSILFYITKNELFFVLIFVVFASVNADTLSSEIGVLSKGNPFYLIGFKKIDKGISGGVSLLGLFAAFIGSLLIAGYYYLITFSLCTSIVILVFGFLGSIFDSVLGQFIQTLYFDEVNSCYTEKKFTTSENKKVKGFVTNDGINFIAPTITAGLCALAYALKVFII